MAVFEFSMESQVLRKYKETKTFRDDEIIGNNLSDISCPDIRFINTAIKETILDRALFDRMTCTNVLIKQCDFNELKAPDAHLEKCSFFNCKSLKADFSGAIFNGIHIENCIAHSIRFSKARITDTLFTECQMYKAKFDNCIMMKVAFQPGEKGDLSTMEKTTFAYSMVIDSSFSGINLMGAIFTNTVFIGCDFTQSIMDNADLSQASFIHCIFDDKKTGMSGMHCTHGNKYGTHTTSMY